MGFLVDRGIKASCVERGPAQAGFRVLQWPSQQVSLCEVSRMGVQGALRLSLTMAINSYQATPAYTLVRQAGHTPRFPQGTKQAMGPLPTALSHQESLSKADTDYPTSTAMVEGRVENKRADRRHSACRVG